MNICDRMRRVDGLGDKSVIKITAEHMSKVVESDQEEDSGVVVSRE